MSSRLPVTRIPSSSCQTRRAVFLLLWFTTAYVPDGAELECPEDGVQRRILRNRVSEQVCAELMRPSSTRQRVAPIVAMCLTINRTTVSKRVRELGDRCSAKNMTAKLLRYKVDQVTCRERHRSRTGHPSSRRRSYNVSRQLFLRRDMTTLTTHEKL